MITKYDRDKLGNAVIYIASHCSNLSKTKLLKLLYFMEEYSVRRFHTPFLGFAIRGLASRTCGKRCFY